MKYYIKIAGITIETKKGFEVMEKYDYLKAYYSTKTKAAINNVVSNDNILPAYLMAATLFIFTIYVAVHRYA